MNGEWRESQIFRGAMVYEMLPRQLLYVRKCKGGFEYTSGLRSWVFLEQCSTMEEACALTLITIRME